MEVCVFSFKAAIRQTAAVTYRALQTGNDADRAQGGYIMRDMLCYVCLRRTLYIKLLNDHAIALQVTHSPVCAGMWCCKRTLYFWATGFIRKCPGSGWLWRLCQTQPWHIDETNWQLGLQVLSVRHPSFSEGGRGGTYSEARCVRKELWDGHKNYRHIFSSLRLRLFPLLSGFPGPSPDQVSDLMKCTVQYLRSLVSFA